MHTRSVFVYFESQITNTLFTGIIEKIGRVSGLRREMSNLHIDVEAAFTDELKIDQSVAHNGVCLTVVAINGNTYTVTAVDETLTKTNLGEWKMGDPVNLERAMISGTRLDGHMVQGHVDQTAKCVGIDNEQGSWTFSFEFIQPPQFLLVNKGSVCIDGVSLTVAACSDQGFSVAIIPYTFEHTIFKDYTIGSTVNIEFDVIGKYVHQYMKHFRKNKNL